MSRRRSTGCTPATRSERDTADFMYEFSIRSAVEVGEPAGGRDDDAGPSELAFDVYATPHGNQPVVTLAIGAVEPAGQRGFCRTGEERDQSRQQVAGGLIAGCLVAPVALPQPHFEQQEQVPQRDLGPHEHL